MTECEMQVLAVDSTNISFGAARRMGAVVEKVLSVVVACACRVFARW